MLYSGGKNKHPALFGQLCHMSMYSIKTQKHQRYNYIYFCKMTIFETQVPQKCRNPLIQKTDDKNQYLVSASSYTTSMYLTYDMKTFSNHYESVLFKVSKSCYGYKLTI